LLELCRALEQTARVTDYINKNGYESRFWEGGIEATRLLGPAAHYALSIPRMTAKTNSYGLSGPEALCEMVRLSLLILIAGLKRTFSLIAGETAAFQKNFQDLLPLAPEACETCPELGLWSMIVVACSYTRPRQQFLIRSIRYLMARMSINEARDAVVMAESIIWVERLLALEAEGLIPEIESTPVSSGT
jgi:hypothetical protein